MKSALNLVGIAVGFGFSAIAYAQAGDDAVINKGCLGCHAVDQKKIGPAFKVVAAKYKDDKSAAAKLVGMLKDSGGKGHPRIQGSDAELKAAIQYVLKQ